MLVDGWKSAYLFALSLFAIAAGTPNGRYCSKVRGLASRTVGVLMCKFISSPFQGKSYFVVVVVLTGAAGLVWQGTR